MSAEPTGANGLRPPQVAPVSLSDVCTRLGVPVRTGTVTGVSLASGSVRAGDLYAALPGARTHGARFAAQAVEAGAAAILTDPAGAELIGSDEPPVLVVDDPRSVLGDLAAYIYRRPATAFTTVGVTGTQGKTTVTRLMESAFTATGAVPAVIGTIGTRIAGEPVRSALTTPEAPALHALFAMMRDNAVTACAMEVSSHALAQGRVDGVRFDVAVFLNLGHDHLDFHGTLEEYFAAKAELFTPQRARCAVINTGDPYGRQLVERTSLPVISYAVDRAADWRMLEATPHHTGTTATVAGPDDRRLEIEVPLPGMFNVVNALAVIAALATAGYDPVTVAAGIAASPGVPGRMQSVALGQDFQVVVDYAHKPDAVRAVLSTLRPVTSGRLLVVIGAGGDRDTGKRGTMGRIAAELADVVIVTDDNPRSEQPAAIRAAVRAGADQLATAEVVDIGDRAQAIATAIRRAESGDCVVIAGKGHEQGQEIAGRMYPFDDTTEAENVLRDLLSGSPS